ncbi:MAG TPA: hypothetical protein VGH74_08655, partial [Planctomycetaceae bacterium]
MSHETFEDVPTESLAVLEPESGTDIDCSDTSVAVAVRPRHHPQLVTDDVETGVIEELPESKLNPAGVARRFRDRFPNGLSWAVTIWMVIMHVGAVAALWYFTWAGLALLIGLHFVTACLGVTLGFHRLLTHGSLIV